MAAAVVVPILLSTPARADTTVQVEPGYAGSYVPGQPVPVAVTVSADRLLRGSLEITVGSGPSSMPVAMPVEVPGGGQKRFVVVAGTAFEPAPPVAVRLRQADRVVASADGQLRANGDQELVGVLPGVLRGRAVPGTAALAVDAGTARFIAIGPAELAGAPGSLGPLSTLAMDAQELGELPGDVRSGVLTWVQDGGRLLVDAERGRPVPGLPEEWQPGPAGRAAAGLGEVVATEGAMGAGRWANLVEPNGSTFSASSLSASGQMASSLASEAGLRSPKVAWLAAFLVAYVVVVGPLLFLAVRRRGRPELAWVAVPLVAVLFSTGSYVAGRHLRHATRLVHGTVLVDGPAGTTATSYLGVFSSGGQTARIGFPTGWSALADAGQGSPSPGARGVTIGADGPEVRIALDAGQFATVGATGPAPQPGGLAVSASTNVAGQVTGTVRNTTGMKLERVVMLLGSDGVLVGTLAPGQQRDWTLTRGVNGFGPQPEFGLWGNPSDTGGDGSWDPSLWLAAAGAQGFRTSGVVAAGWTRQFSPTITADGRTVRPGGQTVVVGRAPVRLAPGGDLDLAIRQDVVRDPFNDRFGAGGKSSVVRFVLPDGMGPADLVLRGPFLPGDLWVDGAWQSGSCGDGGCGGQQIGPGAIVACGPNTACVGPPTTVPRPVAGASGVVVPPGAVHNGVVYARFPGPVSLQGGPQVSLGRAT
jgi:hypothetical protein